MEEGECRKTICTGPLLIWRPFFLSASPNCHGKNMLTPTHLNVNMNVINKEPIFADFANSDEDGAIRLVTNGTLADLKRMKLSLSNGQKIWLTDNDVEMVGTIASRDGIWVAIPDFDGFKPVTLDAPYHIKNLKK